MMNIAQEVPVHLTAQTHRLFAHQHGVASVAQLRQAGLSARQIRQLEEYGSLILVLRGAYRTPSVEFGEAGRCAAVSLARPQIAVAGPTAGRFWGFRRLPPDHRIHVIAPRATNPAIADWVVPYRTDAVHPSDIIERSDGIRVTSRARTALDLSRWLGPDDLLSVIEQAMHDGRLSDTEMAAVAVDWTSSQRPWVRRYLEALGRRLPGGAAESHPEIRVALELVNAGVRGLVRQYEIDLPGYGLARFDLAIPSLCWAIEIDVHPRHHESAGARSDARRDMSARSIGWTTSRITSHEYANDLSGAVAKLATLHASMRLRPSG